MMPTSLQRLFATAPGAVIAVAVLAVGTAAAPSHARHVRRHAGPRLVATPAHLGAALRLAPGDRVERLVALRKRGRGRFASISFVARAKSRSLLGSDRDGLRVELRACPASWVRHAGEFVCAKKTQVVLAPRPIGSRTRLKRLRLHGNRPVHLKLVLSLPAGAGNALEGQTASLRYSFVGVARR
jgi:hypothetical protein